MPSSDIQSLQTPPVEPGYERVVANDHAFLADCQASLSILKPLKPARVGPFHLTYSEPWGLICRADFTFGETQLDGLVNRFIGWRTPSGAMGSMLAIGQNVPPLDKR